MAKVTIPVVIKNGRICIDEEHSPIIKLQNGHADLVVEEYLVNNSEQYDALTRGREELFFNRGTCLYFAIRYGYGDDAAVKILEKYEGHKKPVNGIYKVPVVLLEDLKIIYTGFEKSRLEKCKCKLPYLDNEEVDSLNSAYTRLSMILEPRRKSYGGSVFLKCYYNDVDNSLIQLEEKRRNFGKEIFEKLGT